MTVKPEQEVKAREGFSFAGPSKNEKHGLSGPALFSESFSVYEIRNKRLVRNRNLFGFASAILLCLALIAVKMPIPFEPILAAFFSTFGVYVVFAMKVRESRWRRTTPGKRW